MRRVARQAPQAESLAVETSESIDALVARFPLTDSDSRPSYVRRFVSIGGIEFRPSWRVREEYSIAIFELIYRANYVMGDILLADSFIG